MTYDSPRRSPNTLETLEYLPDLARQGAGLARRVGEDALADTFMQAHLAAAALYQRSRSDT